MSVSILGYKGAGCDPVTFDYPLGNGYRWYRPGWMSFNASDSFSPFGFGGINPYAYCALDPINRTDPSGHVSWGGLLDALDLVTQDIRHTPSLESGDHPMGVQRAHSAPSGIDTSERIPAVDARRTFYGEAYAPVAKKARLDDQPGPSGRAQERRNAPNASPQIGWDIHAQANINVLHGRLDRLESQLAELRNPLHLEAPPHTARTLTLSVYNARQVLNGIMSDSDGLTAGLNNSMQPILAAHPDAEARLWGDSWGTDPAANAERIRTNLGALHDRRGEIEIHIINAENLLSSLGQNFSTTWFKF